jgi:hypothetical protein
MLWYSPAFLFRKFFISSHIHTTKDSLSFAYIHFSAAFSQSFLVFTVSFCHNWGKDPMLLWFWLFSEYIRFYTPGKPLGRENLCFC